MKLNASIGLGCLLAAVGTVHAIEIGDYVNLNGLIGAYQTNGGYLTESATPGSGLEAKVRANLTGVLPLNDNWTVFGRIERDLNFNDLYEGSDIKNGQLRNRYQYIGFEHSTLGKLWYGKDWGASYAHMPILKQRYLPFQDVAAGQAVWRNSDTLIYQNTFYGFSFVVSTGLSDVEHTLDYDDDAFTTDGNAITVTYGASPFFGEGFGIGYTYHDAGLYGAGWGNLYKDKGDATHNVGMNYRFGQMYLGATIAKSDLNEKAQQADLNKFTYDIMAEYAVNAELKVHLHHAQVYGNYGNENERFVGYGIHYNLISSLTVFSEGRFSDGGDSGNLENTHVLGLEFTY